MPQAIFAYHLGMDAEQYAFFRIPKLLITEPYFRRLSTDAKLLYGLMLDRMSLSMRNGWMDDDGHVYIYFTLEEACEQLCCKTDKAVKLFAELDSAKGVGLIRRVKQGLGRPAKIYVLRFMGIEDEPDEDMSSTATTMCDWRILASRSGLMSIGTAIRRRSRSRQISPIPEPHSSRLPQHPQTVPGMFPRWAM